MEPATLLGALKEGGIAATAIFAIIYIVRYMTDSHRQEVSAIQAERQATQTAFMAFVEANNHQKTELVQESTKAIVEAKNAISTHTEILKAMASRQH